MHGQTSLSRYGWLLALLAIFALWLRVESTPAISTAHAGNEDQKKSERAADASSIGVVDIAKAVAGYQKYLKTAATIQKQRDEYNEDRARQTAEAESLYQDYKQLDEKSDEGLRLKRQLERIAQDMVDAHEKFRREDTARTYQNISSCYEDLLRAADLVKKDKKLDIILNSYEPDFDPSKSADVFFRSYRTVVRYDESLDITKDVIAYLNKETL
ncbi:OmpH family outer membrane protein [Anatilimnocola sp. NA78]|uniref:OmpH family outer membrane protein n=1 Tax=Anatilimnocola sp. NA78 TaxID=3415683 RepID=UPI003CE533BD